MSLPWKLTQYRRLLLECRWSIALPLRLLLLLLLLVLLLLLLLLLLPPLASVGGVRIGGIGREISTPGLYDPSTALPNSLTTPSTAANHATGTWV
jgi:hypothetical protein